MIITIDNPFANFQITKTKGLDRNKIYYGFIHNFSSIHTREAYTRDLQKFLKFLALNFRGLDELKVEHAHIVAFKESLIRENSSQRSVNRHLACLWSFYEYLIDEHLLERNPAERVKRFKIPRMVKTQDLSDEQVTQLLTVIDNETPAGKLHLAVLTLFFTTGMRHREVSHLKIKNLEEENGMTVLKYIAKGAQEMIVPLNPKGEKALAQYLSWCHENDYSLTADDYIFRSTKSRENKPLDPKSLNYIIKRYAKKIGVTGKITIHSARSTVIGMLLDRGHALERVADFVGHKDISMTRAYNKRRLKVHQSLSLDL